MGRNHKPELTDKNAHSAAPALQALVRALAVQMARQDWANNSGLTDGTHGGNGATHRDPHAGHPSAISSVSSELHVPGTSPLGDTGRTHDRRRTRR